MFVTNWISTTKIQKISEITNFFRHYFLSRTEVKIDTYFFSFLYINQLLHPILRCFAQYLFQFRPIVLDSPRMDLYFDSRCKITNF